MPKLGDHIPYWHFLNPRGGPPEPPERPDPEEVAEAEAREWEARAYRARLQLSINRQKNELK